MRIADEVLAFLRLARRLDGLSGAEEETAKPSLPSDYDSKTDDQTEKFVEIKQRLTYFLVSASVAPIVFALSSTQDKRAVEPRIAKPTRNGSRKRRPPVLWIISEVDRSRDFKGVDKDETGKDLLFHALCDDARFELQLVC